MVQVLAGREQYSKSLIERFVDEELIRECLILKRELMKNYRGEWKRCVEVLLPGYLIIDTDYPEKLLEQLQAVPTLTKLLTYDDILVPLSAPEIDFVNMFTNQDNRTVGMSEGIMTDDTIIILNGPLMNHSGLIKNINRRKKLAFIGLNMFGRDVTIKVGLDLVRKQ